MKEFNPNIYEIWMKDGVTDQLNNLLFAAMKEFNPNRCEIYSDFLQYCGRILWVAWELGSINLGMS